MKKNKYNGMGSEYGEAKEMSAYEKKISFLNRYFVYKKIRHVNTNKVLIDDDIELYEKETPLQEEETNEIEPENNSELKIEISKLSKPKIKKQPSTVSKTTKKLKQKMVIEE
jgi:hypothetical protein